MFPASIAGAVRFDDISPVQARPLMKRLVAGLSGSDLTDLRHVGDRIEFRRRLGRGGPWTNPLANMDSGWIEVAVDGGVTIKYECSMSTLLLTVSAMVAVLGVLAFAQSRSLGVALGVVLVGWSWLFGMNYVVSALRIRRFIRSLRPHPLGECPSCGAPYDLLDWSEDSWRRHCPSCHAALPE